uniref:RNA exonuclease 4 n=1 Tax=Homalodisca liturata TaxID=320908 RepID=A0A1B6K7N9_9HEMI
MFFELVFILVSVIYLSFKAINFTMINKKHADSATSFRKNVRTRNSDKSVQQVISLLDESEVIENKTDSKTNKNSLANISHKQACGANNWFNFIRTQSSQKSLPANKNTTHVRHARPKPSSKISPESKKYNIIDDLQPVPSFESANKEATRIRSMTNYKQTEAWNTRNTEKKDGSKFGKCTETKLIAMDCEMVGVDVGVNNNMLARVSLVNAREECIYDKYVKPTEPIIDYRTHVSGIRPKDLINAHDFKVVQKEVADILKGKILVGHALKNDLNVLYLTHPKRMMRDTSRFYKFREGRTPALKKLVKKYLDVTIQEGEHNSVQDALATMQLYRMFRKEWEASLKGTKKNSKKPPNTVTRTNMMVDV